MNDIHYIILMLNEWNHFIAIYQDKIIHLNAICACYDRSHRIWVVDIMRIAGCERDDQSKFVKAAADYVHTALPSSPFRLTLPLKWFYLFRLRWDYMKHAVYTLSSMLIYHHQSINFPKQLFIVLRLTKVTKPYRHRYMYVQT